MNDAVKKQDKKASSKQVKELAAKGRQETADREGWMQYRKYHSEKTTRAERFRNLLWKLSALKRKHRQERFLAAEAAKAEAA